MQARMTPVEYFCRWHIFIAAFAWKFSAAFDWHERPKLQISVEDILGPQETWPKGGGALE